MTNKTTTDYLRCPACGHEIIPPRDGGGNVILLETDTGIPIFFEGQETRCSKCGIEFTFDREVRSTSYFTTHYEEVKDAKS